MILKVRKFYLIW